MSENEFEFTIHLDASAERNAKELADRMGLANAIRFTADLARAARVDGETYQQELFAALGGPPPLDATEQRRTRATRARPEPPTTTQEVEQRVRAALGKPRTMRGLQSTTAASQEQIAAALSAIGATKHGQKWSLPKEQS